MPIYQTAYARWEGRLRSPAAAWWVIAKNGLTSCIKFWPLAVLLVSWTTVALVAGAMFALGRLVSVEGTLGGLVSMGFDFLRNFAGREFAGAMKSDPSANIAIAWRVLFFALFRFQIWWQAVIGVIFVPMLVTNDLRTNATEFYLSRSVGKANYFFGKLAIAGAAIGATVLVPAALCYLVGISFTRIPGIFAQTWLLVPRFIGASLLIVVVYSATMAGISAVSKNRTATVGLWLALIIGTDIMAGAIAAIGGSNWLSLARLVSFRESVLIVVWNILGLSPALEPWRGSRQIDRLLESIGQGTMWPPALGIVIAVTALCSALVLLRIRNGSR